MSAFNRPICSRRQNSTISRGTGLGTRRSSEVKSTIAIIEEADSALYQAKNAGRNQVKAFLSGSQGQQV